MKQAMFYESLPAEKVRCDLCPNHCLIMTGESGRCRGKKNIHGVLYAVNYGRAVTLCIDPVEKKPLYHYYPASSILSVGNNTCSLNCDFCQNYHISQQQAATVETLPETVAGIAQKHHLNAVAFTYAEPLTWYEYILDAAQLLGRKNIKTVLVTNGYINREPLLKLLPNIDAMNIDLKAMSDSFYEVLTGGKLEPVLETIKTAYQYCHIEITNLLIPGENDDVDSVRKLRDFIAEIDKDIPLHFSRYYPQNRRETPPTSPKTLNIARNEAVKKLKHVYLGNILTKNEANTYCPNCGTLLIERHGFRASYSALKDGKCMNCHYTIYGRFI